MPVLHAWVDGRKVGEFSEQHQTDGSSLFAFEYTAEATETDLVSLTMVPMPIRRFEGSVFPAPFDMILPEGERRVRIEQARKIVPSDPFSLLSYVGANPVNRVRFLPAEAAPGDDVPQLPTPREIAECEEGRQLFTQLIRDVDLRQGIAGVQPKILGSPKLESKLSPEVRQYRGSTHILKSSPAKYPFLAVNEYICLEVFKTAGLTVPSVTLSADGTLLLVERFDLLPDGSHLGFEEAAALMGETSATKYERDYGSLFKSLAAFAPEDSDSVLRRDLTKALLLNYLLGNGDAHLKNFGMLYHDDLDARLAPFYDCVSTLPYIPNDIPALALSFEWYSKAWWPRQKLEQFAHIHGKLSADQIKALIEQCIEAVNAGIGLASRYGKNIAGFAELASQMQRLWQDRVAAFV